MDHLWIETSGAAVGEGFGRGLVTSSYLEFKRPWLPFPASQIIQTNQNAKTFLCLWGAQKRS